VNRATVTAALAFAAYVGAVLLPNVLIAHFGFVDVAPGPWTLMAPAAVYAVGVALVARDVLHESVAAATGRRNAGVHATIVAIAVGTALSAAVADPHIAVASAVAFALSEAVDLGVYLPLRRRGWTAAAVGSSAAGLVVDSVVFLWLAFGSLAFLPGQIVGKAVAVLVTVAAVTAIRAAVAGRRAPLAEPA
jgi:uncharacterized PurR-regulated membrane protein YhhQ (DUF165 family)